MDSREAKTFLTGLCLAALLSGGSMAVPGAAFGAGASGCSTTEKEETANGNGGCEAADDEEEPEGNGA